jgi:hypothetical protein
MRIANGATGVTEVEVDAMPEKATSVRDAIRQELGA